MDSYTLLFKEAQELAWGMDFLDLYKTFEDFHSHPELYHFIIAPEGQLGNDHRALNQAKEIDPEIYQALYDKGPSLLGNGSPEIDGVESRHILILTYLISKLGKSWGNVVEVGGGYGNYVRLVDGLASYETWSIVDLDYISDLQDWFIANSNINTTDITCYSFEDMERDLREYPEVEPWSYDLLLGVHSLSEFDIETFNLYLPMINKARWFCYVSQTHNPSKELLDQKQALIRQQFILKDKIEYEGGASIIHLFLNKDI
jgi:hypothetical protein